MMPFFGICFIFPLGFFLIYSFQDVFTVGGMITSYNGPPGFSSISMRFHIHWWQCDRLLSKITVIICIMLTGNEIWLLINGKWNPSSLACDMLWHQAHSRARPEEILRDPSLTFRTMRSTHSEKVRLVYWRMRSWRKTSVQAVSSVKVMKGEGDSLDSPNPVMMSDDCS